MIKKRIIILSLILAILIQEFLLILTYSEAAYTVTHNQVTINANSNNNNGISAFPESYQIMLKKLVADTGHTNWKFKAFYTDIDWNELTNNENICLRNTIYQTNTSWICSCGQMGDSGFLCASSEITNYYLDPRNFLSETTIFQFLDLSNSTVVPISDIQSAVAGTYLAGNVNGMSYAQMIYNAAAASNENALSIVVKIFQELGKGTGIPKMISGTVPGYENVYNFFNYGATDGVGNIERGLEYARNAGWTTPEKALVEGAKLISNSYMKTGQNTKYTLKFDVIDDTSNGLFLHQYCTNVQDPHSQAKSLYDKFSRNGWLNKELTFIIPVYKNMPTYVKLPTNLNTNDGTLYFISTNYDNVIMRSGCGTVYSVISSIKRNTIVVMQNYNLNNSGWSQIKTAEGLIGYVSNKYLTPVNMTKDKYSVPGQPPRDDNETSFNDISKKDWYYEAVKYCYDNKIILGLNDETFSPKTNITRGQLVTILWRMEGEEKVEKSAEFIDVPIDSYYYNAINWAYENGIINGYGNNMFAPKTNISRQQLAVILCNYAKYKGINIQNDETLENFEDTEEVTEYAVESVKWAVSNGIINGLTKNGIKYISPKSTATRAEAAAMIYNYNTKFDV